MVLYVVGAIDTDPGIDDAFAIFYALKSQEIDVLGLTSVYGNASIDQTTHNALALVEMAGGECFFHTDAPVGLLLNVNQSAMLWVVADPPFILSSFHPFIHLSFHAPLPSGELVSDVCISGSWC